jgi:ribosomal protein S6--L-glutamate ligase
MGFRMLLGREAMSGRVLADPEKNILLENQPETLKDLIKNAEKSATVFALASNPELYSNSAQQLEKCVATKCTLNIKKNVP